MAQLPNLHCWIKVLDTHGNGIADGAFATRTTTTVRYVVANDSALPAGPLTVVGALYREGVKIQPGGQPNVVPAQLITVQAGQIWQKEYTFFDHDIRPGGHARYEAKLLGDVGNFVKEADETDNVVKFSFTLIEPPH